LTIENPDTNICKIKKKILLADEKYDIQLFVMNPEWTNIGYTDGVERNIVTFHIHQYTATRYVKIMANEEEAVFLQLCEIEVYAISRRGKC
jgi:hypothetical protein